MFKLLKFFVWTACAVGLGIFLAQYEIDGRTPLEHARRAWNQHVNPSRLDKLKHGLHDALGEAQEKIETTTPKKPSERYSADERGAVNRIIARRQTK